jgi:hypothetical protein
MNIIPTIVTIFKQPIGITIVGTYFGQEDFRRMVLWYENNIELGYQRYSTFPLRFFFYDEKDLTAFKLKFGSCYEMVDQFRVKQYIKKLKMKE